ncbi:MAG TPA: right-handed parallel beta-helix repeat-containing protein [Candidatus Saccharimonadales bacterium]|nr:right-handed parallel beta-helix repeat-containing protein [Candidatus Saccharimonadales bacterium]
MRTKVIAIIVAVVLAGVGIGWWLSTGHKSDKKSSSGNSGGTSSTQRDTSAPPIQINVPLGSLLTQDTKNLQVAVQADSYASIARVEYFIDGVLVTYSTKSPFTVTLDVSQLAVGDHTLYAVAYGFNGTTSKSDVFTFTITQGKTIEPSNGAAQNIVKRSISNSSLGGSSGASSSSGSSDSGGSSSGGDNGGNNNGGSNGGVSAWPDTPPALVCGNTGLLNGLTSAPVGAVTVPAGNNSSVNFTLANTTYWFAPGTHTIGSSALSQIIPGNNAVFVGAPGAILDGQGINSYAFTQHATGVKIQYLTVKNFVAPHNEGVVNHDSGTGWTIEYNTLQNNSGGAVFAGTNGVVRYNCLKDNGQYGFQAYSNDPAGPNNVLLDHNEISGNNTDNWEVVQPGCGCTGGGKFWNAHNVTVSNNYVHDNHSVGLWADTNDTDFLFEGNYISGNEAQGLFYEISYNMIVRYNNFVNNAITDGPNNASFPTGAIYLSEAGGDSRVAGRTANIDIYSNKFTDNWSGVVLWENADRFCNSPANTSSSDCTLVNPAATLTTCNDPAAGGSINVQPYLSDCRWKTQNVKVHNNTFEMTRAHISGCTINNSCGYQGIFSNVGSFPSWSPYIGSGTQTAITFNQNNTFSNNTYLGDWNFKVKSQSNIVNFSVWQTAPYSQDAGSTFNGQNHLVVANAIDDDTATLEGSIGLWQDWFSETITRTTAEAHSGTHSLKVAITAPFGWGVQLSNPSGYPVTTTPKNISFWGKLGSGTNLNATMRLTWLDSNGTSLRTDDYVLPALTTSWQQKSATNVSPPANTATVNVQLLNSSGTTGNSIYLDDFVIADAS